MDTRRATRLLVPAALALSLAVAACEAPAPEPGGEAAMQEADRGPPAVDTAAIMATFDSLRTAFEEAVAAGDFQAQAAVYASDAIYSSPGSPPVRGRESIRAALEAETPPGATLEIEPMETRVLGPDWVYEMGTGTMTFTPEGASRSVSVSSTYLAVFHRTPEGWRLLRESLSAEEPPPDGT